MIIKTPLLATLLAAATLALPAYGAELRIGLQEDPDVLDPDQSRTFVGRIVYASLCDKLVDITPELETNSSAAWSSMARSWRSCRSSPPTGTGAKTAKP